MSLNSFNGIIGGKNEVFGINVADYASPEEYVKAWMEAEERIKNSDNSEYDNSIKRIDKLLSDNYIREFVKIYLSRTYLRKKV